MVTLMPTSASASFNQRCKALFGLILGGVGQAQVKAIGLAACQQRPGLVQILRVLRNIFRVGPHAAGAGPRAWVAWPKVATSMMS